MHLDGLWLKKVMNGNVLHLFVITLYPYLVAFGVQVHVHV